MCVVTISLYCSFSPSASQSLTPSINLPPSTVHTDPPPTTPPTDLPPSPACSNAHQFARVRLHFLTGARALLRRVLPRFRRSQSSIAEPTELLRQCSRPGDVSASGPADIAVPAAQDSHVCHISVFLRLLNTNDFTLTV